MNNSIELSRFSEANSCSVTQEFLNILRNSKIHYCVHNSLPLASFLSQMNPVRATPSYFSKIYFNIVTYWWYTPLKLRIIVRMIGFINSSLHMHT
jgi:hypothetical protein